MTRGQREKELLQMVLEQLLGSPGEKGPPALTLPAPAHLQLTVLVYGQVAGLQVLDERREEALGRAAEMGAWPLPLCVGPAPHV